MSVQVQQYRVDDLEAAKNPETGVIADVTVRFSMGGTDWEIDLTAANAEKFRRKVEPYTRAGRRMATQRRSRPVSQRKHSSEIRSWAKAHGIAVSERGRIPGSVVEQYEAAVGA